VVNQEASNKVWLVVEDEPSIRLVVSTLIKMWGRTPLVFEDGHQAYRWLDEVQAGTYNKPLPELALLDIRMPGPQGYEIGERLRSIGATSKIPIVMMTAWRLSPEETERVDRAKPDKKIDKPLPMPEDFKKLLEKVLEDAKAKQAAETTDKKSDGGTTTPPTPPASPVPPPPSPTIPPTTN
jgi:CheY-like chemotaxis protein